MRKMGYNAILDSGVIIITVDNEKAVKMANKSIKATGYNASYGIRIKQGEKENIFE